VVVEDDAVRPRRLGAGGDDDVVAADRGVFGLVVALDENGVRVKESAVAGVEIDLVAPQLERTITCGPGFTDSGD
jgi:hypothetical protein